VVVTDETLGHGERILDVERTWWVETHVSKARHGAPRVWGRLDLGHPPKFPKRNF
jgi:hypothetical protein